jgi:hypothetical protein
MTKWKKEKRKGGKKKEEGPIYNFSYMTSRRKVGG